MQFSVVLHDLLIFGLYVMDKYWSDTIWQRTAQDRVIWRRHAEAFAQPLDTTPAKLLMMMIMLKNNRGTN